VVDFIADNRRSERTTYVHCRNGVSRGGMAVTAYLMREHGWTRDEALERVQTRRPIVRPHPVFMERLSEWERELFAKRPRK
jgi:protein-tyrosine phosphatase